jgi:hypothetical protein
MLVLPRADSTKERFSTQHNVRCKAKIGETRRGQLRLESEERTAGAGPARRETEGKDEDKDAQRKKRKQKEQSEKRNGS